MLFSQLFKYSYKNMVKLMCNLYGMRQINAIISIKCVSCKKIWVISKKHCSLFLKTTNMMETYYGGIAYSPSLRNRYGLKGHLSKMGLQSSYLKSWFGDLGVYFMACKGQVYLVWIYHLERYLCVQTPTHSLQREYCCLRI